MPAPKRRRKAPSRPLPGLARYEPPRQIIGKNTRSAGEDKLAAQIKAMGLPAPAREYRFHPKRLWRFDFAWPGPMLAVEVEGGGWVQGRHGRGAGMEQDCVKYSEAALAGWTLLRVTPAMINDQRAIRLVWRGLGGEYAYTLPDS